MKKENFIQTASKLNFKNQITQLSKSIQFFLAEGKTREALEHLLSFTASPAFQDEHNELIVLSGEYEACQRTQRLNLALPVEISAGISRVNSGILSVLQRLNRQNKARALPSSSQKIAALTVARIATIIALGIWGYLTFVPTYPASGAPQQLQPTGSTIQITTQGPNSPVVVNPTGTTTLHFEK